MEAISLQPPNWVAEFGDDAPIVYSRYAEYAQLDPDEYPLPSKVEPATKVAIVGFGVTRNTAPFGEPGWELWGLNDPPLRTGWHPREACNRWFQLHPPAYLRKHYPKGIRDLAREWSEPRGVRLYMDRHYPEYPDSEPFPKEAVEALTSHGRYHASSFDWMIALAILEGFTEIALHGVDFFTFPVMNGEPISARACLEYWIGVAEGRGIRVRNAGADGHVLRVVHLAAMTSDLQYGFEREPALDLSLDSEDAWEDVR